MQIKKPVAIERRGDECVVLEGDKLRATAVIFDARR